VGAPEKKTSGLLGVFFCSGRGWSLAGEGFVFFDGGDDEAEGGEDNEGGEDDEGERDDDEKLAGGIGLAEDFGGTMDGVEAKGDVFDSAFEGGGGFGEDGAGSGGEGAMFAARENTSEYDIGGGLVVDVASVVMDFAESDVLIDVEPAGGDEFHCAARLDIAGNFCVEEEGDALGGDDGGVVGVDSTGVSKDSGILAAAGGSAGSINSEGDGSGLAGGEDVGGVVENNPGIDICESVWGVEGRLVESVH